jgi:Family of unknown function (DUF6262)
MLMTRADDDAEKNYDEMVRTRKRASTAQRREIRRVVKEMVDKGEAVTFAEVRRRTGASLWLLYQPGLKEFIAVARGIPIGGPE